jgi:hypothetical protein
LRRRVRPVAGLVRSAFADATRSCVLGRHEPSAMGGSLADPDFAKHSANQNTDHDGRQRNMRSLLSTKPTQRPLDGHQSAIFESVAAQLESDDARRDGRLAPVDASPRRDWTGQHDGPPSLSGASTLVVSNRRLAFRGGPLGSWHFWRPWPDGPYMTTS